MARDWPEPETEPKAPDKAAAAPEKPCETAAVVVRSEKDVAEASGSCKLAEDIKDSGVSSLDDRGLQALLDEAIAYKNPKDREQSSDLFKKLLAKVEADEREHSGGQRGISGIVGNSSRYRRGPSRKGDVSERNSRGGSLQNLPHALNSDLDHSVSSSRKRGGRRNPQPQVSVSARQREGGSLPCNVNADFYGAASLLRSHDDVGTSTSLKKRNHHTPIDDVVTGNSYSYKLPSASSARTAEDLSGYRVPHSGKRATDSVDDIETAAPRGPGGKRRELKKLGHSSDAIFPESTSDGICSMEDLTKEKESNRFGDFKNENENLIDFCATELASYYLNRHNNVDRSTSDHSVVEIDSPSQLNGPSMLGVGMNGSVRPGPEHRWIKSESRKDDNMDGTEMIPIERTSEIPKYSALRPNDHEVDQPIKSELMSRKSLRSNGEHMVPLSDILNGADFAGGDSMRKIFDGGFDKSTPRSRTLFQVSSDKNMHLLRVDGKDLSSFLTKDSERKNLDVNGNALHQGSGSERKSRARKHKTDNNNYVLSEKIPGHRGDTQDINELILFIESPSNCQDIKSSVSGKNNRNSNGPVNIKDSKQRNSSSNGKRSETTGVKVKAEKRKSNEKQKLQKSNSLEEISYSKLSDLTSSDDASLGKGVSERQSKKQTSLDKEVSSRESRQKTARTASNIVSNRGNSRGNGSIGRKQRESSSVHRVTPQPSESINSLLQGGDLVIGDPAEFHVVTKKQRKKKSGRSSSIGRNERGQHSAQSNNYYRENHSRRSATVDDSDSNILYQYHSAPYRSESPDHSQHQRRKSTSSMPPSDKSADSSDLDSVHSLPISPTTPRQVLEKTSTSSGSTPQASYADIARMASALSPPQGCVLAPGPSAQAPNQLDGQGLPGNKWPSVGQTKPSAPLWTANVTLHTATSLPASQEEGGDQCFTTPVPAVSSSVNCSSTKRDAMTNTIPPQESESDCSSVGNLLSDLSYPPLCETGKCPSVVTPQTVTQCVQTFISQASRTSPAISPGVMMANCVDVEDSAKRAASPAAFDSVRDNTRTSGLDRPAVIILDEAETETTLNGDPELTFGFEINEMLLSGTCVASSDDEVEAKPEPEPEPEPELEPAKAQPAIMSVANINLDKIVAFVGRAWEDVMKELPCEAGVRGRVQFYSGQ
ncbi:Glutamyl-tRNA(Gln) amidotransferase subunit A [Frankliniella fusca]|uniref:Glutamyl-tRNA(Gln) amidotransferase subunit A n=1 Tax=Frankliniella fusca TaxID=407009 RepID=A0AAE1LQ09_9NEOP|nr:Glutamyl-tRNA(Gln) amidotransferase subunit A [Frankliniella fusca]